MNNTWVVVDKIPNCNMCKEITPAYVDGATVMGPWANMCEPCFDMYGVGLGLGKGQRLLTDKHKMERADEEVMEPPDDWDWDIERDDPQWDIERGT